MTNTFKVLHLATEPVWRGGENQLRFLLEGSQNSPGEHHVVVREGSEPHERFASLAPVVPIKSSGRIDLPAAVRLAGYCRDHGIQILDAQSSHAHNLGLMIKLQVPHLKFVVHRRVDYFPGRDLVNRLKYRSQLIDRYVAISEAIGNILKDYGIPPERVRVVRSAVSDLPYKNINRAESKQQLAERFGVDPKIPFIGNASALTEQKGYDVWLQSLALLRERGQAFHGFIAGKGHLNQSLLELCQSLGLNDRVTFTGFTDDVPSFLSALDILLISSQYEGLGTVILDGIYAGCLVVGTAVGGIPEIVQNEKTGLLAPPNSPTELANMLQKALQDEQAAAVMVRAAQHHVEANFSLSAMIRGNNQVYSELVAGS